MNDIIDLPSPNMAPPPEPQRAQNLKAIGWVSYVLHLIVAVAAVIPGASASIALLLLAFIIDIVKKSDARASWQESHFAWRIRSVLWCGVLYVLTYLLTSPIMIWFALVGVIWSPLWPLVSIWFLYRIVRGMVCMNDNRPVGVVAHVPGARS